MNKNYSKDLFQLQTELIDAKVDMAVSKSVDRVIEQIIDLKGQMNSQFSHLESHFSKLEHRVDNNDKALYSITNLLGELRSKFISYSFRGGWVVLAGMVIIIVSQLTQLVHYLGK